MEGECHDGGREGRKRRGARLSSFVLRVRAHNRDSISSRPMLCSSPSVAGNRPDASSQPRNIDVQADLRRRIGRCLIKHQRSKHQMYCRCDFRPILAHKAEEEGIAAVECMHSGQGHVNNEDKAKGTDRILGVRVIGASLKLSFDGRSTALAVSYLISGPNANASNLVLVLEYSMV